PRRPIPPLFPYTTLFRSVEEAAVSERQGEQAPLRAEGNGGISVVRGSGNCRDWNGIHYKMGLSAKNTGARELSMNVATIPPGGVDRKSTRLNSSHEWISY